MDIILDKILELIKDNCKNQKEFASEIGFGTNVVSEWKSGKSKSYEKYVDKIANFFDVDVDYLLGNQDIKKQAHQNGEPVNFANLPEDVKQILNKLNQMDSEHVQQVLDYVEFLEKKNNN